LFNKLIFIYLTSHHNYIIYYLWIACQYILEIFYIILVAGRCAVCGWFQPVRQSDTDGQPQPSSQLDTDERDQPSSQLDTAEWDQPSRLL